MFFPPPARYYVPMLVFVFGLAITWFGYELNLANDLSRNLKDVVAEMDATGERLARRSGRQLERGEPAVLAEDLATWAHQPWLKLAALVDENGVVIDDSEKHWLGQSCRQTPLAPAMEFVGKPGVAGNAVNHREERALLYGAYPFAMGNHGAGWALVVFDRGEAIRQAYVDARSQRRWVASAMALLCLCLWAALHFGFQGPAGTTGPGGAGFR